MYKSLLLLVTFFGVSSSLLRGSKYPCHFVTDNNEWVQFTNFQQKFNKKYDSLEDMENHFNVFRSNLKDIIIHNLNQTHTYTMGINQFTDLTSDEFKETYANGLSSAFVQDMNLFGTIDCKYFSGSNVSVPSSIDWREKNAVSSVKDQGQCGSCWSFAASGAIESAWAIEYGQLYNLSEQELVDCAGIKYGSMGCNGGQIDGAFKYAINHGMCTEESYPYVSGTTLKAGSCLSCIPVVNISTCIYIRPNDQISLKVAVANGPVSVAIEADTKYFQSYSGGILTSLSCGTNLNHGVLIVGYGNDTGQDYWLVKNSWSSSWGENGYIRIARSNNTNDAGVCGIAVQPSYPVVT
jgi:C1A family cysteine protease